MELSPEEKQKIYLEEKARLDAQEQAKKEKNAATNKKGCFGCLGVIVIILIVGSLAGSCGDTKKTTTKPIVSQQQTAQAIKQQPKVKTYRSGQYKVGVDIPAGEYIAIARDKAYIEIAKNATGTLDSILANDIFLNRSIISVNDGEFLKIQGCELYSFKDAPKPQERNGFLPSGMYKVGVDLPAGEYKIISEGGQSYAEISSTSRHTLDDIISNELFTNEMYIQVSNGQYVKLFMAKVKIK
ncbi:hypothetical protein [Anaeroselena agilis]|uniref:Uncharacterized protein n=1 Tax=Anaeroselena agilis TaxID=3063788 RepID=A0ABU3NYK8_9FIRM|nr:hypothetical protein [Selenomonadales bacterium 4137-cl]